MAEKQNNLDVKNSSLRTNLLASDPPVLLIVAPIQLLQQLALVGFYKVRQFSTNYYSKFGRGEFRH